MFIVRSWNIEISSADVIDSFIVNKESAVRVLNGAVSGQHSVVWFNDGG
jgi:hypothetical protein